MPFWWTVGAVLMAVAIAGIVVALLAKPVMRALVRALTPAVGEGVSRLLEQTSQAYNQNPLGLIPVMEKLTPLGLLETRIRAETGQPPERPLGSPIHFSPWDALLLTFSHVDPMPTPDAEPVSLAVRIGPRAAQPLTLKSPVLIGAMSYGGAVSLQARRALAQASAAVGTATNSGEGVFIREERKLAQHYIIQYHRGTWPTSPQYDWDRLEAADAIEIQLSQGAQGAAPMTAQPASIHPEMRKRFGLDPKDAAVISSRLEGVDRPDDLITLVQRLKARFPVPVGIKFAATNRLEREVALYIAAGIDFLTVDGAEGGTHGGPPILQDAMGLPTLWAIARTRRVLERHGVHRDISLIAAGGLTEPGHFLKAIALGATACYSASAIVMALLADQLDRAAMAMAPSYALLLQSTQYLNDALDTDRSAQNVVNLFRAWHTEFDLALRAMGKTDLAQLTSGDLVARSRELADALHLAYVGGPEATTESTMPARGRRHRAHRFGHVTPAPWEMSAGSANAPSDGPN